MKLMGNKTERDFREELLRSNKSLQEPESRLRQILSSEGHNTKNAYVLNWTPEQREDCYTVLIDGKYLIDVEVERTDNYKQPVIESRELKVYMRGLSKINQIRLAVARDLTGSNISFDEET